MIKVSSDIPGSYELTCINFDFCDNKRHVVHFIRVLSPFIVSGKLLVKMKKSCQSKNFILILHDLIFRVSMVHF